MAMARLPSFLDLPDEYLERVVVIYGASKAYAMTGWRIGAALAPTASGQGHGCVPVAHHDRRQPAGASGPRLRRSPTSGLNRTFSGWSPHSGTGGIALYRAVPRYRAPGVEFVEPHGAFYFFFRVDGITKGTHQAPVSASRQWPPVSRWSRVRHSGTIAGSDELRGFRSGSWKPPSTGFWIWSADLPRPRPA